MKKNILKVYMKSLLPTYSTEESACFDISAHLTPDEEITFYDKNNVRGNIRVSQERNLTIFPGCRYLIPTGLKFDLDKGTSLRVYARSGLSLKKGLVLANGEGIIDSDYVNELFILLYNISDVSVTISDSTRIAQGEIVGTKKYLFEEMLRDDIELKGNRKGGFGSTGE